MTDEQREVYEALFFEGGADTEVIVMDEEEPDPEGKTYKRVVEVGDDLGEFVKEAAGGTLPKLKTADKDDKEQTGVTGEGLSEGDKGSKKRQKKKGLVQFKEDIVEEKKDVEEKVGEGGEVDQKKGDVDFIEESKKKEKAKIQKLLEKFMDEESEDSEDEAKKGAEGDQDEAGGDDSEEETPLHLERFQYKIKPKEDITDMDFPPLQPPEPPKPSEEASEQQNTLEEPQTHNIQIGQPTPSDLQIEALPEVDNTEEDELDAKIQAEIKAEEELSSMLKEEYREPKSEKEGNPTDEDLENQMKPQAGQQKITDEEFSSILDDHLRGMGEEGKKYLNDPEGDLEAENVKKPKKQREERVERKVMPGGGLMIIRYGVKKKRGLKGKKKLPGMKGIYKMHFEHAMKELAGLDGNFDEAAFEDEQEIEEMGENGQIVDIEGNEAGEYTEEQLMQLMQGTDDDGKPKLSGMEMHDLAEQNDPELQRLLVERGMVGDFNPDLSGSEEEGEEGDFDLKDYLKDVEVEKSENSADLMIEHGLGQRLNFEERMERDKLLPDYINGLRVFKRKLLPKIDYKDDLAAQAVLEAEHKEDEEIDYSKPPPIEEEQSVKEPILSYTPFVKVSTREETLEGVNLVQETKQYGKKNKKKRRRTVDEESEDGVIEEEGLEEEEEGGLVPGELGESLVRRGKKLTKEEKKRRKELVKQMKKERRAKKQKFKKKFEEAKKSFLHQRSKRVEANSVNGLSVYKIH